VSAKGSCYLSKGQEKGEQGAGERILEVWPREISDFLF